MKKAIILIICLFAANQANSAMVTEYWRASIATGDSLGVFNTGDSVSWSVTYDDTSTSYADNGSSKLQPASNATFDLSNIFTPLHNAGDVIDEYARNRSIVQDLDASGNRLYQHISGGDIFDMRIDTTGYVTNHLIGVVRPGTLPGGSTVSKIDMIYLDPASITMSPVPIPAAIWLFSSALLGFAGFDRYRK
jgi:hypothetical protein